VACLRCAGAGQTAAGSLQTRPAHLSGTVCSIAVVRTRQADRLRVFACLYRDGAGGCVRGAEGIAAVRLAEWGEIFGDAIVAPALLDRLMHNAGSSTSRGRRGGCENTTPSNRRPPSQNPPQEGGPLTFAARSRSRPNATFADHRTRSPAPAHNLHESAVMNGWSGWKRCTSGSDGQQRDPPEFL